MIPGQNAENESPVSEKPFLKLTEKEDQGSNIANVKESKYGNSVTLEEWKCKAQELGILGSPPKDAKLFPSFYKSWNQWADENDISRQELFPREHESLSAINFANLNTLEDWIDKAQEIEIYGLNPQSAKNIHGTFYKKWIDWADNNGISREQLMPRQAKESINYSNLVTSQDWIKVAKEIGVYSLSPTRAYEVRPHFVFKWNSWADQNHISREVLFPCTRIKYEDLATIDDWERKAKEVGVYGLRPKDAQDLHSSFYGKWYEWADAHNVDRGLLFPPERVEYDKLLTIEDWISEAIRLEVYGLSPKNAREKKIAFCKRWNKWAGKNGISKEVLFPRQEARDFALPITEINQPVNPSRSFSAGRINAEGSGGKERPKPGGGNKEIGLDDAVEVSPRRIMTFLKGESFEQLTGLILSYLHSEHTVMPQFCLHTDLEGDKTVFGKRVDFRLSKGEGSNWSDDLLYEIKWGNYQKNIEDTVVGQLRELEQSPHNQKYRGKYHVLTYHHNQPDCIHGVDVEYLDGLLEAIDREESNSVFISVVENIAILMQRMSEDNGESSEEDFEALLLARNYFYKLIDLANQRVGIDRRNFIENALKSLEGISQEVIDSEIVGPNYGVSKSQEALAKFSNELRRHIEKLGSSRRYSALEATLESSDGRIFSASIKPKDLKKEQPEELEYLYGYGGYYFHNKIDRDLAILLANSDYGQEVLGEEGSELENILLEGDPAPVFLLQGGTTVSTHKEKKPDFLVENISQIKNLPGVGFSPFTDGTNIYSYLIERLDRETIE